MPGVCFYFEPHEMDVWSGKQSDLDAWNYAIKAAGDIDQLVIINRTNSLALSVDDDLPTIITADEPELFGRVAHVCCPWNSAREKLPLWDFDHQIDWYKFGPSDGWGIGSVPLGIYVPVANQIEFHAVHAASIVMAHRYGTLHGC